MKTQLNLLFVLVLGLSLAACQNQSEATEAGEAVEVPAEATLGSATLNVDTQLSVIDWKGRKIVGDDSHTGTLNLASGQLNVKDDQLVGGSFVIDMNSLTNTDMAGSDGQAKLEGHLKSGDFFELGQYPTASFEIAGVAAVDTVSGASHMITGNLTMKDVTKSVSFPASVMMKEGSVLATTLPFTINRTDWNVQYGSTLLGVVKDKAISDDVTLTIKVRGVMPEAQLQ